MVKLETELASSGTAVLDFRAPPDREFSAVLNEVQNPRLIIAENPPDDAGQCTENSSNISQVFNTAPGIQILPGEEANPEQPEITEQDNDEKAPDLLSIGAGYPLLFRIDAGFAAEFSDETRALNCAACGSPQPAMAVPAVAVSDKSSAVKAAEPENTVFTSVSEAKAVQEGGQAADKGNVVDTASGLLEFAAKPNQVMADSDVKAVISGKTDSDFKTSLRSADELAVNHNRQSAAGREKIDNTGLIADGFEVNLTESGIAAKPAVVKVSDVPRFVPQIAGRPGEETGFDIPDIKEVNPAPNPVSDWMPDFKHQTSGLKPNDKISLAGQPDRVNSNDVFGLNPVFEISVPAASFVDKTADTAPSVTADMPVFEQIVGDVKVNLEQGRSTFSVKLHPEGLGELFVKMTMDDGKVFLELNASLPSTRDLISGQLSQLKEALAGSSIHVADFSVNCSSEISPYLFGFSSGKGFNRNTGRQMYYGDQPESYDGYSEKRSEFNFKPGRLDYKI